MPLWRFIVARHSGSLRQRQETCAEIKALVQKKRLSSALPMVKYETSHGREYYLGLAVAGRWGMQEAEREGRLILETVGVKSARNRDQAPMLDFEQAQFLQGNLGFESFTDPIQFEPIQPKQDTADMDLSEELEAIEPILSDHVAEENIKYEYLLLWCTANGSGDWTRLKMCAHILGLPVEKRGIWSVLRKLVLLGHVEFDGRANSRWSILPPTLVASASAKDDMYLVGQRPPALLLRLRQRFEIEEQAQPDGPTRLLARGASQRSLADAHLVFHHVGQVGLRLAELLPSLDGWASRLEEWKETDFARFTVKAYDPKWNELVPISIPASPFPTGFYGFYLDRSTYGSVTYAFYDAERDHWICGDYYGLRFLARAKCGRCKAHHEESTQRLLIPGSDRWPMPYERALVMASGLLPQQVTVASDVPLLIYQGIPRELAARLCQLLGLTLESD